MSFNSTDYSKAPWAPGCMVLNHEECQFVIAECDKIKLAHPDRDFDDDFIVGEYNLLDWKKAINGDTYDILSEYGDHVDGIDENGVIEPTTEIPAE